MRTSGSTSQTILGLTLAEIQQQWSCGHRFECDPLNEDVWRVSVGVQAYYFPSAARAAEFYADTQTEELVTLTMPRGQVWGTRQGSAPPNSDPKSFYP